MGKQIGRTFSGLKSISDCKRMSPISFDLSRLLYRGCGITNSISITCGLGAQYSSLSQSGSVFVLCSPTTTDSLVEINKIEFK